MMFKSLLIANRGEIACRIIRTAQKMGISTVAVYSDADRNAAHVQMADVAVHIGPSPARESYLDMSKILAAAQATGAEAIHPGYGFLSERADFAEAVTRAGLVFVGPSVASIRAMGDKAAAKQLMEKAGVPMARGYHGAHQAADFLFAQAEAIGWPVLLKASAGGGGKGMRPVYQASEFHEALAAAQREALAAFGDDRMLIEQFVQQARHIEVQILADTHGNTLHLFERDCSVQRRNQKVIEEAPAPNLPDSVRQSLHQAAVAAAKAVAYYNAGTIEFLYDARTEQFSFMEMNTRLQVEHPVTEAITGLDLVEWQLRIAAGEVLPFTQADVTAQGHALEVRLYAEDPRHEFLPQSGILQSFDMPVTFARVDSGYRAGDEMSGFYDPMLAKIIVHAEDRTTAVAKMRTALAQTRVGGIRSNRDFLCALAWQDEFLKADLSTRFITDHATDLLPEIITPDAGSLLAAVRILAGGDFLDTGNPWQAKDGWRLNLPPVILYDINVDEQNYRIAYAPHHLEMIRVNGVEKQAIMSGVTASRQGESVLVTSASQTFICYPANHLNRTLEDISQGSQVIAPMPGKIIRVSVSVGDAVQKGQTLVIMEAMKMEHAIKSPRDTVIESVDVVENIQVREGEVLVKFASSQSGAVPLSDAA